MPSPVSPDALEVLSASTLSGLSLTLPDRQLERPLYEEVNKILVSLGGKWSKGKKAHVFKDDPRTSLALIAETGRFVDVRKDAQFFPTPPEVVARMIEATRPWGRILEPSAGQGSIALAIKAHAEEHGYRAEIECCEFLAAHRKALAEAGLNVVGTDFLHHQPAKPYDCVLMNPPFALEGDPTAYITHILHAWGMLREGGSFAAIVPPGWLSNSTKKQVEFREWVCDRFEIEEIGEGAFKAAGTGINTLLIHGTKDEGDSGWRTRPHNGWPSYHAWHGALWLDNDFDAYQRLQECNGREEFDRTALDAVNGLRRRQFVPLVLRPADLDAIWLHHQDE